MADSKISALPASTVPLAGTEVLPIVQSSTTRQVSVANLTAGRAISATQLTLTTGNLIVASGQGIDFSATSHPAGMTSELLTDYEEGTWTPTLYGPSGTAGTYAASVSGTYTKVGRQVHVMATASITNLGSWSGNVLTNLPFTPSGLSGSGAVRSQLNTFDGTLVAECLTSGELRFNVTKTGTSQVNLQWTDLSAASGYLSYSLTYFV
jgi:hypothetical protein